MAKVVIRNAPIYFKGKKIAEVETGSYEISSGDEPQFGTDGLLGHSSGAITTKITLNVIVPVAGISVTMTGALLAKEQVTMGILVDAKLHQIDMNPMSANFQTDSKAGKVTGAFEFNGGAPVAVG
jgi:hypothetical protein